MNFFDSGSYPHLRTAARNADITFSVYGATLSLEVTVRTRHASSAEGTHPASAEGSHPASAEGTHPVEGTHPADGTHPEERTITSQHYSLNIAHLPCAVKPPPYSRYEVRIHVILYTIL